MNSLTILIIVVGLIAAITIAFVMIRRHQRSGSVLAAPSSSSNRDVTS